MGEMILQVNHLSKSFGTHEVLRDIDFTVNKGDVTSIIGASGSGKSTLLRCINLLENPSSGEILCHGENVVRRGFNAAAYRSRVGMVFQSFNLFNNMTVLENCIVGQVKVLKKSREEARQHALYYLEKVGMAPYINAKPRQISGGQKQRVAIARALATNPKVLLCDEATSALDPSTTDSILALIKDINRRLGITAVIITHEMSVIEKICSHVAIIAGGKIAECGPVEQVFYHPTTEAARIMVTPEALSPEKLPCERLVRIVFNGTKALEPIIGAMMLDCGKPMSIFYSDIREVDGVTYGQMVLQLPDDAEAIRRIYAFAESRGLVLEELYCVR